MRLQKKFALDDMKSARELAKENKETINAKPKKLKRLSRAKCGIENPCVFGKHNPEFDKIYLSETKRKAK